VTPTVLEEQVLATWRLNNDVLLYLFDHIPPKGMTARPSDSKGRDVRAQFAHLCRVREAWVGYFRTGQRPKLPRFDKAKPPTRAQVRKAVVRSGREVGAFLQDALRGAARTRMFGTNPLRWLGYLIAHDSHHRGQILLALKQSGYRLPDTIAIQGIWGKWIFGKETPLG
jgi:uncharacterized damage-inducible protein DinB